MQTYLGMEKPFAVESGLTTRLLDTSFKMDARKAKRSPDERSDIRDFHVCIGPAYR